MSMNNHSDLITIIILGTKTIGGLVLLDVAGHPEEKPLQKLLKKKNWLVFFLHGVLVLVMDRNPRNISLQLRQVYEHQQLERESTIGGVELRLLSVEHPQQIAPWRIRQ